MKSPLRFLAWLFLSIACVAAAAPADLFRAELAPTHAIWVDTLDITRMQQRRGLPRAGRSIRDQPIVLGGVTYPRGIGTRSISELVIDLDGQAERFTSVVGFDDAIKPGVGSVTFEVWADDALVAGSGLMRVGDAPKTLSADLKGARVLTLLVDDGGDRSNDDEVAWAGAHIVLIPKATAKPRPYDAPPESGR